MRNLEEFKFVCKNEINVRDLWGWEVVNELCFQGADEDGAGWWIGAVLEGGGGGVWLCNYVGEKKKKVGSDLLESRRTEGAPVDFISSSVKAGANTSRTRRPLRLPRDAFMSEISPQRKHPQKRRGVTQRPPRSLVPAPRSESASALCFCACQLETRAHEISRWRQSLDLNFLRILDGCFWRSAGGLTRIAAPQSPGMAR